MIFIKNKSFILMSIFLYSNILFGNINNLEYKDFKTVYKKEIEKAKNNNDLIIIIKTKKNSELEEKLLNDFFNIDLGNHVEVIYITNNNIKFNNYLVNNCILFYNSNEDIFCNIIYKDFKPSLIKKIIKYEKKIKDL